MTSIPVIHPNTKLSVTADGLYIRFDRHLMASGDLVEIDREIMTAGRAALIVAAAIFSDLADAHSYVTKYLLRPLPN